MKTLERFLRSEIHPLTVPLTVFSVSAGRLAFEYGLFPAQISPKALLDNLAHTSAFYLAAFLLFSLVLKTTLGSGEEKAKKAACAGLLVGLLPPILDLVFGAAKATPYAYFTDFSFSLFSPRQSPAESAALACAAGLALPKSPAAASRCWLYGLSAYLPLLGFLLTGTAG